MEKEADSADVWVLIEMVDASGVECRGTPDDPVHLIALRDKKFR